MRHRRCNRTGSRLSLRRRRSSLNYTNMIIIGSTISNGAGNLSIFDAGKGFEFIPTKPIEVIIGLPPYEERSGRNPAVGFGDWPFLLLKYRLLSANEENGNYCVTPFVAFTAPTGSNAFSTKNFGGRSCGPRVDPEWRV